MLKSCQYCGRIHAKDYDCGKKPKRSSRFTHSENERGRYSYAFTEMSKEIKERSHYLCAACLHEGQMNSEGLETHHIEKLRERPDLLLEPLNLVCLCRKHHEQADAGELSREYLWRLARERETGPPGWLEAALGKHPRPRIHKNK